MNSQFSRTAIYISFGLSVAMVLGVIFGAKYVFITTDRAPVAIANYDSKNADSPECESFVAALPQKFLGNPQVAVAQPQPAGTAAWATYSDLPVTLRCGVDLPFQYNRYSVLTHTTGHSPATWLQIKDMTPGSDLTTWYSTDRNPVVAITTHDSPIDKTTKALGTLDLSALHEQPQDFHPAPLSTLPAGTEGTAGTADTAATAACTNLLSALPTSLADDYSPAPVDPDAIGAENTRAWQAPGREAIVLRCGVAPPPNYQAGARLTQVNQVPWFEDTTLAEGTTASTWYALGRSTDIAAYIPQDLAAGVLVTLSELIKTHTPEEVS